MGHSQHDFHRFLYDVISRITTAPDAQRAYNTSPLIQKLIQAVLSRDEVVQFAKDLFANAKIEVREEEHVDSFYSSTAFGNFPMARSMTEISPGGPTDRKSVAFGKAMLPPPEVDSAANMETAVNEAKKILKNLMSFTEVIPLSLRYLCKMIIDCLLYTSPSPRDLSTSRMPSSA
eukprot:TRINITY_DN27109_c0_g1_i2.p2 TRINITY_DN27109_c0_g1~~TRINITY_DN27109_c0_g1_i2.p2  ORF type:complete len:175 (+),score=22.35 TRINITY_DN27109_c0_g1_i2:209-733(+)